MRGVKPRSSCLLSSELSAKYESSFQNCSLCRRNYFMNILNVTVTSAQMRSHLRDFTLSCQLVNGQSWQRSLHHLVFMKVKVPHLSLCVCVCVLQYLPSSVAGRTVTSFPRCLLVRVVECLKKLSSSTSMFSEDSGTVACTTTGYLHFNITTNSE